MAAWRAGVAAAHPGDCVSRYLTDHPDCARRLPRSLVIATGKAATAMARGLGDAARGLALAPHGAGAGADTPGPGVELLTGSHPVPDAAGIAASRIVLETVRALGIDDQLIYLVSGGTSALFEVPDPRLGDADVIAIYDALVRSGAAIHEINSVRRALSSVKGGRLAAAAWPASVLTLAISDVAGDDPATIGSGPTVAAAAASPATAGDSAAPCADALEVARRLGLEPVLSAAARDVLARPAACGSVRSEGFFVLASAESARAAAQHELIRRGYRCVPAPGGRLDGDARSRGRSLASGLRELVASGERVAFAAAGETTVRVPAAAGRGGRNQHLAAVLADGLAGVDGFAAVVAGTDGVDGNSDAAGAIVDGGTAGRAAQAGVPLQSALDAFDSATALAAAGDALVTGPTGTNVEDLLVAVADGSASDTQ